MTNHSNETFRRLIKGAIDVLAPHFGLSFAEVQACKRFEIRRELTEKIYRGHSKKVPAYSFLDNFFFFPKGEYFWRAFNVCHPELTRKDFNERLGHTGEGTINHETGHRLHNFVNPHVKSGFIQFVETGKRPKYHTDWTEFVAEYGNMILSKRDYNQTPASYLYSDCRRIFLKFGPEFLPALARMSLQEVLDTGLLVLDNRGKKIVSLSL